MNQHISQDEIRRIIIIDMVKKRNSIVSLALLRLSGRTLNWIRSVFKEGSKVIERFKTVMDISDRRIVVNNFASPRIGIQRII